MRWILGPLLLVSVGCGHKYEESFEDGLRLISGTVKSKGNGVVKLKLPVEAGETALLATIEVHAPYFTHFEYLDDPDKEMLFDWEAETDGIHSKTNAGFIAETVTMNWPILQSDDDLHEGKYKMSLRVVEGREYVRQPLEFSVLLKEDDDFSGGLLNVAIVYAGGTDEEPDTVAAVELAVDHWVELYAAIGIDLAVATYTFPSSDLDPPAFGTDSEFEEIASMTSLREVNVVIAPEIAALEDVFGIAGDIPGPLVATRRSGVLISALLSSGMDGEFNEGEIRILGETLAHETGHYLGLFHPVETTFDTWDALSDTPDCDSESECVRDMEDHLMFPFPVCGLATCTPQSVITEQQDAVVNRHVAIE